MAATLAAWPEHWREFWIERAGVYEFLAEMPRPLAEQSAFIEVAARVRAERETA